MARLGRIGSRKTGGSIFIVTPATDQVDPSKSTIGVSASTVASGSLITVTLTAKNAASVQNPTGGLTVVPSVSGGTATGTLSAVTDVGNGTYTWTYTGVLAGTAQTMAATINGVSATGGTAPTCAVTPGAINRTVSTLTLGAASAAAGGTAVTATLQAKDAAGNNLTAGGSTVVIGHAGGTSVVSIGAVTDVGNGTYTAQVTPTTEGTATTMSATIGGQSVTTTMPTFTVTVANPSLFTSDWSTALGGTDNAILDGGKATPWTMKDNQSQFLDVVSTSGLGMPAGMTNCLRHTFQQAYYDAHGFYPSSFVRIVNTIPLLAIGETLYARFYYRQSENDQGYSGHDNSHHNFEGDNRITNPLHSVLLMHPGNGTDGTYPLRWAYFNNASNYFLQPNTQTQKLTKHVPYRWEVAITVLDASYLKFQFRLYGADDSTLLYPGADGNTKMINQSDVLLSALSATTFPYTAAQLGYLRSWEIGNNGGSMGPFNSDCYDYFAGIRFSKTTWNGAYSAVTG